MTHQCPNHGMILHIHQERTDALDVNSIAKEFAQANDRRIAFFDNLKIFWTTLKFTYML